MGSSASALERFGRILWRILSERQRNAPPDPRSWVWVSRPGWLRAEVDLNSGLVRGKSKYSVRLHLGALVPCGTGLAFHALA